MMYVVWMAFVVTCMAAMFTNSDLMSPAKLFLVTFFFFHVGGLISSQGSTELWLLVLLVLQVGLLIVVLEATIARPPPWRPHAASDARKSGHLASAERRFFIFLWLFSIPALFSQAFIVQHFGGLEGYVNALGLRVLEWRGLGWAKTLIATLLPVNLIYFATGLTKPRSRTWWTVYGVHFTCLVVVGLLSGSRSGLLNTFALQLICYHYFKRRISPANAVVFASGLMLSALFLGVVREGLKLDDGALSTGLDAADSSLKIATLYYGIEPLELLIKNDDLRLAYGTTFLSLLTNAIPRDWWPDKPDSGGVYFTKLYTDDAWDGASNLTPTFLGEWVMNFGWAFGLLMFVLTYSALFVWVTRQYRGMLMQLRAPISHRTVIDFLMYVIVMWSAVALMAGEVTNVVLNALLTQILPLLALRTLLTRPGAPFA